MPPDVMQVIWTVKHTHIGDAFFDLDAAAFLCTQLPQASSSAQSSGPQPSAAQEVAAQGEEPQETPQAAQCYLDNPQLQSNQHRASQQQYVQSQQSGDALLAILRQFVCQQSCVKSYVECPGFEQLLMHKLVVHC